MEKVINKKRQLVCKGCGHPKKCHDNGCIAFEEPCPCFPEKKK